MNNKLIFKNQESLSNRDILLQILFGVGVLLFIFIIGQFRFKNGEYNYLSFFGLSAIVLVVWVIQALRGTTLHKMEVNLEADKLIITLDKHFGRKQWVTFNIKGLNYSYSNKPDRLLPKNKILTMHDDTSTLEISSRQKGLSEEVLNAIVEKLKVLLTTTPIR